MNDRAKVVRSGDGQTVELPEGYWFDASDLPRALTLPATHHLR